jgi:hypothetical protein
LKAERLVGDLDITSDLAPAFRTFPAAANVDDDPEEPAAEGFREGLPKTYRSRHDLHYVEQLTAPADSRPVRLLPVARIDAADLPAEHTVADLTKSITELGVLQPLMVRPHDGRFRLIAGRRRLVAARSAGVVEVPCLVYTVTDQRAGELATADNLRVDESQSPASQVAAAPDPDEAMDTRSASTLSQLQETIAGLQACLHLVSRTSSASTREHVALKLLAVETERAAWFVRSRQYLASALPIVHTPIGGAALVDQIKRLASPIVELHGGTLQIDVARGALMLHGDRLLLSTALAGLTQAMFALGESVQDPRVHLRLAGTPGNGALAITIAQPSAVLSEATLSRFFDAGWTERPGGVAAELAVLVARRAASLHRARLEATSSAGAGTIVSLSFGQ